MLFLAANPGAPALLARRITFPAGLALPRRLGIGRYLAYDGRRRVLLVGRALLAELVLVPTSGSQARFGQ